MIRGGLVAAMVVALAVRAHATVVIPVSDADLTRSSIATVVGSILQVTGVEARDGRLYTLVDVAVEEALDGVAGAGVITLKERGGAVGDREYVVDGAPRFEVGERAVLFLTTWPDGSLRTNHLAMGKFRIERDAVGALVARRALGPGVRVMRRPGGTPWRESIPLAALVTAVREAAEGRPAGGGRVSARLRPPEADDDSLAREIAAPFTVSARRFFEPDVGETLAFEIDRTGDVTLGANASFAAVGDALAVWSGVGSANVTMAAGNLTDDLTLLDNAPVGARSIPCPGPHKVRFNDPDGEIPDPVNCTGTLGVGGGCSIGTESKVVGGTSYRRTLRGALTLANGFETCPDWTPCNVAEIATHELGHALGLGHSSEADPEFDSRLRDATMYFLAHFDGRCAGLETDDVEGVSAVYPPAAPPAVVTPDPLPVALPGVPYLQALEAVGGAGPLTWRLDDGGFPGLELSPDGVLSGTPQARGTGFFQITVSDGSGDRHTTVLHIGPRGDANCDGAVTAADLSSVMLRVPYDSGAPCQLADADADGRVDTNDTTAIRRTLFVGSRS